MKLLMAVLLLSANPALAQVDDADKLAEKYQAIRKDLVKDEEERRKVLSDLYKVTHIIRKIQRRRDDLLYERNKVAQRIKDAGDKIELLKSRLDEGRQIIAGRLRALYKFNGQGAMRLLFASQSMADLDRNVKMLKIVLGRDAAMFEKHQKSIKVYGEQRTRLKKDLARLARLEREIQNQEDNLITQQETKSRILESFDDATLERLKSLETIRTLASVSGSSKLEAAFFEKRGKLEPPVKGSLRQRYGLLKDSTSSAKLRFKGHYYEAPEGEPVRAVSGGEVSFTGTIEGYGPTIVLSHGDHYYTVYGGLSAADLKEGDTVKASEVIGVAGTGYYLFSSGVYFEIRHFSDPVNPADWILSSGRQVTLADDQKRGETDETQNQ
ncbi:MAG TPA: peptidoglycan DD-metalloendopeptidase family protein [Bdellovibrionales bacterium]|nr:peptidoglycan DD-metalloendopeptidase family protein [Bdellovibrionales bacterium]